MDHSDTIEDTIIPLKEPLENNTDVKPPKSYKYQQGKVYDNAYLQAPDGRNLCRASQKKIEWYLSRQLGTLIQTVCITSLSLLTFSGTTNDIETPF